MEDLLDHIEMGKMEMEGTLEHLQGELLKIRTGKASPAMLKGIMVDYYDVPTPLNQVANVGTADAKTLTIQPWEKSMLSPIEQAIFAANIGLTPMNDGEIIRINIPPLTEERRKQLVKSAKAEGEDAKVSIRNARQKVMNEIKKAVKDGYPEDMGKRREEETQKMVNSFSEKINKMIEAKEVDIMKV